jgi:hypothetical protein
VGLSALELLVELGVWRRVGKKVNAVWGFGVSYGTIFGPISSLAAGSQAELEDSISPFQTERARTARVGNIVFSLTWVNVVSHRPKIASKFPKLAKFTGVGIDTRA